jgi:hypothetical protein
MEAQDTIAWMRKLTVDHELVQMEYLEIKAESVFEARPCLTSQRGEKGINQIPQASATAGIP